ncbi:hypothetical protein B0H16DRAFT_1454318 [Mycena metata]|uniref:Uncharacterized protein n=1 Tax=Mycena metata TaxID=1033252 RepID=A0AAD7JMU6_9AGAR|nr:hypothetical protein B0H16DRAFT_1454318 [Mycena metata]
MNGVGAKKEKIQGQVGNSDIGSSGECAKRSQGKVIERKRMRMSGGLGEKRTKRDKVMPLDATKAPYNLQVINQSVTDNELRWRRGQWRELREQREGEREGRRGLPLFAPHQTEPFSARTCFRNGMALAYFIFYLLQEGGKSKFTHARQLGGVDSDVGDRNDCRGVLYNVKTKSRKWEFTHAQQLGGVDFDVGDRNDRRGVLYNVKTKLGGVDFDFDVGDRNDRWGVLYDVRTKGWKFWLKIFEQKLKSRNSPTHGSLAVLVSTSAAVTAAGGCCKTLERRLGGVDLEVGDLGDYRGVLYDVRKKVLKCWLKRFEKSKSSHAQQLGGVHVDVGDRNDRRGCCTTL